MMYEDLLLVLLAIIAFITFVRMADRKGWLKKYGMNAYGPFLMWRTQGGKDFIDWLARPKRFWQYYAVVSKWLCLVVMFLMMALLIWEATIVYRIPAESAPGPEMILGIPGINPIIPLWYGILGLVVAIVIHEFAHGVLTRVGGMTIHSMGILLLIVPMGAFVEPDEEALVKVEKRKRMNVYAVGPATNIIVGLVCALIFSSAMMANVEPIRDNPIVISVSNDGPADMAGIKFGAQIVEINDVGISSYEDFSSYNAPDPGSKVNVTYYFNDEMSTATMTSGVVLTTISAGYPADDAGMRSGMMLYALNDTMILNEDGLVNVLKQTHDGQTINATVLSYNEELQDYAVDTSVTSITLVSRLNYYQTVSPASIDEDFQDYGFMGINSAYLGAGVNSPEVIVELLATPYKGADDFSSIVASSLGYIALPFQGLSPIQSPVTDLFEASGIWGALPVDIFWILANSMYWIFWINLMVGLTNVLPAVPLDGGFLFRDGIDSLVKRFKGNASTEERVKYTSTITYLLAMFVLFLIIWQLIGPRLLG